MTAIPKTELMARLRKQRKAAGLVRLELWLPRDLHDKVRKYAANLDKKSN